MKRRFLTTLSFFVLCLVIAVPPVYACEEHENPPPSTPPMYSRDVALSEVYPAPSDGAEEFIELYNAGTVAVDLNGWILADASAKEFVLSAEKIGGTQIAANGYLSIPYSASKLSLNNSGDSVVLMHPDRVRVSETKYEKAATGSSWALVDGSWQWTTTVTSGAANVLVEAESDEEETSDEPKSSQEKEDESSSSAKKETSEKVLLNELFPNPVDSESTDEWIELVNEGEKTVSLDGWQLTDQSTFFTMKDVTIKPGAIILFENRDTKINLNNSGDTVYLIDPFGKIVNGTSFQNSAEGSAWARFEKTWEWTTNPSPRGKNVQGTSEESAPDAAEEETQPDEPSESAPGVMSISAFRELGDDDAGTVEGVVTVLPGVLSTQYFYIQDQASGVQVYSYSKTFPVLKEGDRVRVTGVRTSTREEARLKIDSVGAIQVLGSGSAPAARVVTALNEAIEGLLVRVSGTVTDHSTTESLLDDLLTVAIKSSAGIDNSMLKEGNAVKVVGIVSQSDEEYRVLPRRNEDIQPDIAPAGLTLIPAAEAAAMNESSTSSTGEVSAGAAAPSTQNRDQLLLILLAAGVLGYAGFQWHKKKLQAVTSGATPSSPGQTTFPLFTAKANPTANAGAKEGSREVGTPLRRL